MVFLCLAALVACALLTPGHMRWAFYRLPSRYWELGVGMLLALTTPWWRQALVHSLPDLWILSIVAMAVVGVALFNSSVGHFPFPSALLPVFGAAGLIIAAVVRPGVAPMGIFGARPIVFIGQRSYSLYLWHWPVYVLMRWTCGLGNIFTAGAAVIATLCLALASYILTEKPLRRLPERL